MEIINIEALLMSAGQLPAMFQQNPVGAAVFAGLIVFVCGCWVAVTWIKHRNP
jgi:hypothetical protein